MHYKTQCPACFHAVFEKDLYINRTLDTVIRYFRKVKEKLHLCLPSEKLTHNTKCVQLLSVPPIRPARSPKGVEEKQRKFSGSTATQDVDTPKHETYSPSTSGTPKSMPGIARIFNTPKTRKESQSVLNTKNMNTVSCPVCSVDVSDEHINRHLDACLKREVAEKEIQPMR